MNNQHFTEAYFGLFSDPKNRAKVRANPKAFVIENGLIKEEEGDTVELVVMTNTADTLYIPMSTSYIDSQGLNEIYGGTNCAAGGITNCVSTAGTALTICSTASSLSSVGTSNCNDSGCFSGGGASYAD